MTAIRATRTTEGAMFVATQSGCAEVNGESLPFVRDKTHVREGHPLLAACPEYFTAAEERIDYEVETATAAPGEKRGKQNI